MNDYINENCEANTQASVGIIEFTEDMIMCLCPRCREMFFSTPGTVIKRVNKEQQAKDNCSYCSVRLGFDYFVCEKSKNIQYKK